jgi:hypothetical protein
MTPFWTKKEKRIPPFPCVWKRPSRSVVHCIYMLIKVLSSKLLGQIYFYSNSILLLVHHICVVALMSQVCIRSINLATEHWLELPSQPHCFCNDASMLLDNFTYFSMTWAIFLKPWLYLRWYLMSRCTDDMSSTVGSTIIILHYKQLKMEFLFARISLMTRFVM